MLNSTEDLAVLALAVALDLTLGELPTRFHPTVWMGRTVAFLQKPLPKKGLSGVIAGGVMAALVVGLWVTAAVFCDYGAQNGPSGCLHRGGGPSSQVDFRYQNASSGGGPGAGTPE